MLLPKGFEVIEVDVSSGAVVFLSKHIVALLLCQVVVVGVVIVICLLLLQLLDDVVDDLLIKLVDLTRGLRSRCVVVGLVYVLKVVWLVMELLRLIFIGHPLVLATKRCRKATWR